MNTHKTSALPLLIALLMATSFAVMSSESTSLAGTGDPESTMATCQTWIQENHNLNYQNHGCQEYAYILDSVASHGGGVIPVGDNRFYMVWFPDGWEQSPDREVVFTIHGNGGCAEVNYQWWHDVSEEHDFAVVALQYAEEDMADLNPQNDHLFDEAQVVYANLTTAYEQLQANCPIADVPVALHGFSRGSALNYQLALMDRGQDGQQVFSSFVCDSGGPGPIGSAGVMPGYLEGAPSDAYDGTHFWLYCGEQDYDGQRCADIDWMRGLILDYGGTVDAFYRNPTGGHGMFITGSETPTAAQQALFDYLDALSPAQPTPTPVPTATPSATPGPTSTPTPSADRCVNDANGNGVGDVADIQTTAAEPGCLVYLPLVVANWHQPWPTPTPTTTPTPTATAEAGPPTATPTPTPAQADIVVDATTVQGTVNALNGVQSGPRPLVRGDADLTAHFQAASVDHVRLPQDTLPNNLTLGGIFPDPRADPNDPSAYDFSRIDLFMQAIVDAGIEPLWEAMYDIGPSDGLTPGDHPLQFGRYPRNPAAWAAVIQHTLKHFNDGWPRGISVSQDRPDGTSIPRGWADGHQWNVTYVEFINEPFGLGGCRSDSAGVDACWDLFQTFAAAVHAYEAETGHDIQIVGPAEVLEPHMVDRVLSRLRRLLDRIQPEDLDYLSVHPYGADTPEDALTVMQAVRDLLDTYHPDGKDFSQVGLWASEWQTMGPGEDLQRSAHVGAFNTAVKILWQGLVDRSTLYRADRWAQAHGQVPGADGQVDCPDDIGCAESPYFTADGQPKPAYFPWLALAEMARETPQRLALTETLPEVYALAGGNADGSQLGLLVTRPATDESPSPGTPVSFTVCLDGLPADARYTVERYRVDARTTAWEPESTAEVTTDAEGHLLLTASLDVDTVLYLRLRAADGAPPPVTPAGGSMITYVPSEGGYIAVQVSLPETGRYPDGASVVVEVATFLTGSGDFYTSLDATELGLIQVAYLWPGTTSPSTGAHSDGTYDYGGEEGIKGLRDVLRYVTGQIPDRDGYYLAERLAITPLTDQVGLYAFSHPGIAAVNVLADYGDQVPGVRYLVGRENPTVDTITAVELGYFDDGRAVLNPLYDYPDDYTPIAINLDYSSIRWDADYVDEARGYVGRPYFDLNDNGVVDASDHPLGPRVPTMYDKRFYSTALTQALLDNGALSEADWPADLGTPIEAAELWPYRSSTHRYPALAARTPDLKAMLVFAIRDHVQPTADKPHIHQAYDGFRHGAGLWTRLNPDQAYVAALSAELGDLVAEHPANTEPADWLEIEGWGYPNRAGSQILVPLAAVAEMADRVHEDQWGADLDRVLVDYAHSKQEAEL